jgi:DNA-binding beta-propeller fold protein YncE
MRNGSSWIGAIAALGASVLALGCGSGGDGSGNKMDSGTPLSPGGSGAFGIVTVGGKQKMYLPQPITYYTAAGDATIAVVDVGVAGNGVAGAPALITTIDLGTTDGVTATGGTSSVVIAVSTQNSRVYFIDPTTDTVTKSIMLDATYGTSAFSGGGGYVTGVAVDADTGLAYLSVWNGFAIVDLASETITGTIQVPPSENFGFDSANHRILAPFYDCSLASSPTTYTAPSFCTSYTDQAGVEMDNGLNIIDLADNNAVYTYQDPAAVDTTEPLGGEPDSAAADPTTGKIVVPSEEQGLEYVVDLSMATFDKAKKIVTAPHVVIDASGADEMTGVAIEPSSHLAFFESEGGTDMGVADLNKATAAMSTYVHADLPPLPDAGYWENILDPHGIAVTTAMAGGHPVGFLVNSQYNWVARVDLQKLLTLPTSADYIDPSQLDVADASAAVTYLDATKMP